MKYCLKLVYEPLLSLIDNEGNRVAAETSFYLMFSIAPVLFLFVVAISHLATSSLLSDWSGQISYIVSAYIPQSTYVMLTNQLHQIMEQSSGRNVFVAVLVFLWTSTNVAKCYVDSIGRAYGIPDNRSYLKLLSVSLTLALASGVLLFMTTVVFVLLPLLFRWLNQMAHFQGLMVILNLTRYTGTFLLITPSLAILYKYGPDETEGKTHKIWPGAASAGVLWILSTQLFGMYLNFSGAYQALSGALGGVIILLLWMYLSSLAVIFGAEFNAKLGQST